MICHQVVEKRPRDAPVFCGPQVAVSVERLYPHPKYEKIVKHKKKYMCHDQHEICGLGDRVQIKYVGRLSKNKFWAVVDMIHRQPQLGGEPFPMSRPPASVTAAAAAAAQPPAPNAIHE